MGITRLNRQGSFCIVLRNHTDTKKRWLADPVVT